MYYNIYGEDAIRIHVMLSGAWYEWLETASMNNADVI